MINNILLDSQRFFLLSQICLASMGTLFGKKHYGTYQLLVLMTEISSKEYLDTVENTQFDHQMKLQRTIENLVQIATLILDL